MIDLGCKYLEHTYKPDGSHRSKRNIAQDVSDEAFVGIFLNHSNCESVYLIYNLHTKLTKIGRSNDYRTRFDQIRTGSGCELILLAVAELEPGYDVSSTYLEKYLHKHFNNKKVSGEWFNLTLRDCINIVDVFYAEASINVRVHDLFDSREERQQLKTKYKSFLT